MTLRSEQRPWCGAADERKSLRTTRGPRGREVCYPAGLGTRDLRLSLSLQLRHLCLQQRETGSGQHPGGAAAAPVRAPPSALHQSGPAQLATGRLPPSARARRLLRDTAAAEAATSRWASMRATSLPGKGSHGARGSSPRAGGPCHRQGSGEPLRGWEPFATPTQRWPRHRHPRCGSLHAQALRRPQAAESLHVAAAVCAEDGPTARLYRCMSPEAETWPARQVSDGSPCPQPPSSEAR